MKSKSMRTSPIALFVYNRPRHTQMTVEFLKANQLASESDLIIFSDGAKTEVQIENVADVRKYLKTINGFNSVSVIEREGNLGLAKSIIGGVTEILEQNDRVIVMEDDLVTSPHFLTYMNNGLEMYAEEERIISIHGYVYPVKKQLPETFFMRGSDCWGWATWRRGWAYFNPDGQYLLDELKRQRLITDFDLNGAYGFSNMLKGQIAGRNNSWAIRWHASAFLENKLTLYPGRSLVYNIGSDESGSNCGVNPSLKVEVSQSPINIDNIPIEPSALATDEFEKFLTGNRSEYNIKYVLKKIRGLIKL
jgi:hypothetical protein